MSNKAIVVARVTLTHRNGEKTVIEVDVDAGFNKFYRWYHRNPGKRIKNLLRTSQRTDAVDLAALAARVKQQFDRLAAMPNRITPASGNWSAKQVVDIKVVVIKKRLYKKLLDASADQLCGELPKMNSGSGLTEARYSGVHSGLLSVSSRGYTPIAKRWQILTGKA